MRDQGTRDDDDDFEPAIHSRDCTPVPRRGETADQLTKRLDDLERSTFAFSRADRGDLAPVITDQQVDDIVARVAEQVTAAVMVLVGRGAREMLRVDLAESLRSMAATLGHVQ